MADQSSSRGPIGFFLRHCEGCLLIAGFGLTILPRVVYKVVVEYAARTGQLTSATADMIRSTMPTGITNELPGLCLMLASVALSFRRRPRGPAP